MVELAIGLGRPLTELEALDDATLATVVDVLEARTR